MIIHAPSRLQVTQYWSAEERDAAATRISTAYRWRRARTALKKLKRKEYQRKMAVGEVLDIHTRFLKQLDVLSLVWRAALRVLFQVDADEPTGGGGGGGMSVGEGAELVESIFPHLDSIQQTSVGLHEALHACNRGHHPLTTLLECAHPSYVLQLLARLRDVQRRRWRSDAMTLFLSLQGAGGASQVVGASALHADLAAALRIPPEMIHIEGEDGASRVVGPGDVCVTLFAASPSAASPLGAARLGVVSSDTSAGGQDKAGVA